MSSCSIHQSFDNNIGNEDTDNDNIKEEDIEDEFIDNENIEDEFIDRNAIKAEPITDYEDVEEENYSDKEKPSTSTQLSPLHYPEVSLTEDNSILDVHKVEKEIPYETSSSD